MEKTLRLIAKWWLYLMLYWGVGIGLFVGVSINECPRERPPFSGYVEALIWPTLISGLLPYAWMSQGVHPEYSCNG